MGLTRNQISNQRWWWLVEKPTGTFLKWFLCHNLDPATTKCVVINKNFSKCLSYNLHIKIRHDGFSTVWILWKKRRRPKQVDRRHLRFAYTLKTKSFDDNSRARTQRLSMRDNRLMKLPEYLLSILLGNSCRFKCKYHAHIELLFYSQWKGPIS